MNPSLGGDSRVYYLLLHSRLATRSTRSWLTLHTPLERETKGDFYSGYSNSQDYRLSSATDKISQELPLQSPDTSESVKVSLQLKVKIKTLSTSCY